MACPYVHSIVGRLRTWCIKWLLKHSTLTVITSSSNSDSMLTHLLSDAYQCYYGHTRGACAYGAIYIACVCACVIACVCAVVLCSLRVSLEIEHCSQSNRSPNPVSKPTVCVPVHCCSLQIWLVRVASIFTTCDYSYHFLWIDTIALAASPTGVATTHTATGAMLVTPVEEEAMSKGHRRSRQSLLSLSLWEICLHRPSRGTWTLSSRTWV